MNKKKAIKVSVATVAAMAVAIPVIMASTTQAFAGISKSNANDTSKSNVSIVSADKNDVSNKWSNIISSIFTKPIDAIMGSDDSSDETDSETDEDVEDEIDPDMMVDSDDMCIEVDKEQIRGDRNGCVKPVEPPVESSDDDEIDSDMMVDPAENKFSIREGKKEDKIPPEIVEDEDETEDVVIDFETGDEADESEADESIDEGFTV